MQVSQADNIAEEVGPGSIVTHEAGSAQAKTVVHNKLQGYCVIKIKLLAGVDLQQPGCQRPVLSGGHRLDQDLSLHSRFNYLPALGNL